MARKRKANFYYTRDSEIAFWLIRRGLPTIYEVHGVPKKCKRWLLKKIAHHHLLRLIVVLTSFIKEQLVAMGFPAKKIVVLPDCVDLSLFDNLPSKKECRSLLGLPLDRPIIGYIGRFRTLGMEKGIPELVRAMASLSPINGLNPLLLCVGGPMNAVPAYLDLTHRLGLPKDQIKFVDRVLNREVPLWIRSCDVVTIPWQWTEFSAYFTSPLKLFEYMASNVPIVASDLPSIREILRHGENAWLVEPGNPKALADALREILRDHGKALKLARRAREEVEQYTWEKRAQTILSLLENIS